MCCAAACAVWFGSILSDDIFVVVVAHGGVFGVDSDFVVGLHACGVWRVYVGHLIVFVRLHSVVAAWR